MEFNVFGEIKNRWERVRVREIRRRGRRGGKQEEREIKREKNSNGVRVSKWKESETFMM